MRTVDVAERRARLGRRHALAPAHRVQTPEEASDAVFVLHATDQPTIYMAVWARTEDIKRSDIDRALYDDRSLVKHLCMRRTLFVFRRELLGAVTSAVSSRVATTECRRLAAEVEKGGLQDDGVAWLAAAQQATLARLDELGEATSSQLRDSIDLLDGKLIYAPDKSYGGVMSVAPRVLTTLSAAGQVLRGHNQGTWTTSRPTWVHTSTWLGEEPERPDPDIALDDLVARYLRAFGPATLNDVKWWFGSTLTIIRGSLHRLRAVEVDLDGPTGYLMPDDVAEVEPLEPWAALLPGLDPTTMGWAERDWYLGDYKADVFDSNGNGGPTAWWSGRIVGSWVQDDDGSVVVVPLERLPRAASKALDAEARRLTAWLDGTRIRPAFPSPLSKIASQKSAP